MTLLALLGNVALLLWGTRMVRTGITRAYGTSLRRGLGASTRNRFLAFAVGLGVTGLVQSSTATALMTASFASRQLIGLAPALAIMLGADVGTTLVAQVLSFDVSFISPLLILAGVVAFLTAAATRVRDLSRVAIGLGLMLLALQLMLGLSEPLGESVALQEVVKALAGEPLLALLIAALLTWLAHSSLAMVLLIISLQASGLVPLPLAFALVLGANLGGTAPAFVATLGAGSEARRVALGNVIFKLVGVAVVLPFLDQVGPLLANLEAEPARQIANFHTAFNLGLALVFIFLTDGVAKLCVRLVPSSRADEDQGKPRYLDPAAIEHPKEALAAAVRETLRMGDIVEAMLAQTIEVFRNDDRKLSEDVQRMDDSVDSLYAGVKQYLTQLMSGEALAEDESRRAIDIIGYTTNLEHIGDIIENNLMDLASKKIKNKISFSEEGAREIADLHARVAETLRSGLRVFVSGDLAMARNLMARKVMFRDLEREASESHLARLANGRRESIESSALHLDVLRDLRRINSHAVTPAYPILDAAGDLRASRLRKKSAKRGKEDGK